MRDAPNAPRPPSPRGLGVAVLLVAVLVSAVTGGAAGFVAGTAGLLALQPAASATAAPSGGPAPTAAPVVNVGREAIPEVVRELLPGTVTVLNKVGTQPVSTGSGYVVDAQRGYIITNSHVVTNPRSGGPGDSFDVVFSDERTVSARLVGRDPQTDIAVLQVPAAGLVAVRLGNSDEVPVGAQVIAIGSALGALRNSVTNGIVSAKGRRSPSESRPDILLEDLIQTDAAISPGNSGGPLIWVATRQVIGMNTLVERAPGAEGLGFAVSANTVKQISDELIKSGAVERGFVGIQYREINVQIARALNLPAQPRGVVLTGVVAAGPGAAAGLRVNDVVTRVNDQGIDPEHPLATILLRYRAGDRVRITLIRDGKEQVADVVLIRAPS